jgi:hypothetical protein
MRRKWRLARELSAAEWWILWQAVGLLLIVSLGLRVFGLKRVQAHLLKHIPGQPKRLESPPRVIAQIVNGTARIVRAKCLARSLVLWWLLKRRGIDSQIRMGIRKENGALLAHAWVELDHVVLNDRADIDIEYEPITQFSSEWKFS